MRAGDKTTIPAHPRLPDGAHDIITYDFNAEIGLGQYSGQAGNILEIDYTNDFSIARGRSRSCEVTLQSIDKDSDSVALLCIFRAASNGSTDEFVKLLSG